MPNDGIRPDFKEAMDSYEAFFDEYIDFMTRYKNADNPASMLLDYTSFMKRYADTMEKLDAINEDELSSAESAYYTDVMARISAKMIIASDS